MVIITCILIYDVQLVKREDGIYMVFKVYRKSPYGDYNKVILSKKILPL